MKTLRSLLLLSLVTISSPALWAQAADRPSPHATISSRIGDRRTGNFVMVTYGRPQTADPKTGEARAIWGALVPWDKPWRLGANEATLFGTNKPIVIGDTTIPAGAYTLYLVPSENGTTQLAFSTNIIKWGVPVDVKNDLVRVDVEKSSLDPRVDQLTLALKPEGSSGGVLTISWENTQYSVAFTNAD
tara:strand:+ start:207 stop:770 length:564 start_codon:yes stop_codon:yes gene_type:complete